MRSRATALATLLLCGCITPGEPREAKLGVYQVDVHFAEETRNQPTHTVVPTKGRITGVLNIRQRTTGAGAGLPVEAEFVLLSCEELQDQFCPRYAQFISDPQWGGSIDAPTADHATLQILLDGPDKPNELWLELDGTFDKGVYTGTALLRVQGFCCANPTVMWTRGAFKAAK